MPAKMKAFAVKQFHQRPGQARQKYEDRVLAEFRLANQLQHGNVIRVMELFQDEQNSFHEVMEFCAGGDLLSLIYSTGELEVTGANRFLKQLLRGVAYLHATGVAHR